jgi:murein L,D-transpeptidase YcbB/YkuD
MLIPALERTHTDNMAVPPGRYALGILCILCCLCAGCSTWPSGSLGDSDVLTRDGELTRTALQVLLPQPPRQLADMREPLQRFYAARDGRPVWSGSARARARAASVVFVLQHADRQGLRPADYPVAAEGTAGEPQAGQVAARNDAIITASLLRYAHDVRLGRVEPQAVYRDVQLPASSFDAVSALAAALERNRIDKFLADLPPPHPQYRAMVAALADYRAIAGKGGWPQLSSEGMTPAKLSRRLAMEDKALRKQVHPSAAAVSDALKRFQARNGLAVDGRLGSQTLVALNVPASYRVAQIAANMERWRWLPRQFEDRYISVDTPDQSVRFVSDGQTRLVSKAIIGRPGDNRTPILRTEASAVVVNPPWNIPDDIAARAILPHLRKDPNYLASRNMVLVDAPKDDPTGTQIDWRRVKGSNLPYQIREEPGPDNVLGTMMFDMPNDFDVYLHGSSNAALFERPDRERSHGCVRVQKIADLAQLAIQKNDAAVPDGLAAAVAGGQTLRVPLAAPIPVYLLYWTAVVEADDAVAFRPDRYGRDPPLIARLSAPLKRPGREDKRVAGSGNSAG